MSARTGAKQILHKVNLKCFPHKSVQISDQCTYITGSTNFRKDHQSIGVFSICQLHGQGIAKAWRLALDPELKYAIENVDHLMKGMKRAGQMPAEGGEHALRTVAEKIFQACMSKETEQISLDCLDPRTPAMLEKFKDLCEERFGSLQDAFEKVDVDGVGIVSREDFRMLCHEVKATDGTESFA